MKIIQEFKEFALKGNVIDLAVGVIIGAAFGAIVTSLVQDVLTPNPTFDRLLGEAGTDKSRILMTQIFLADLADFPAMNAVWDAWVVAGQTPPRATVQARLARPEWRIEVVVTAAV